MTNAEVAERLALLADLLAIAGASRFRVDAYRRAADGITQLGEPLAAVRAREKLEDIPGVGEEMARHIEELLDSGRLPDLEEAQARFPPGLAALLHVPDIGPKRARTLHEKLGINDLETLRAAAKAGKLAPVLGEGVAARVTAGLASMQASDRRVPLEQARTAGLQLIRLLRERAPQVERAELAGSARRFRETVGDLDMVAAAEDPESVVEAMAGLPPVARVEMRGPNRCRVMLQGGFAADLRVLPTRHWGSLLHHFTGSKYHNIRLRDLALERGASMSEYGYTVGERLIPCATEEEVYTFLDLPWMPAPMRENTGEIEAALRGELPVVVMAGDLHGDALVCPKDASELRAMALAAKRRGYRYLGVAVASLKGVDLQRLGVEVAPLELRPVDDTRSASPRGTYLVLPGGAEADLRAAVRARRPVAIASAATTAADLDRIEYALASAQRAWLPRDLVTESPSSPQDTPLPEDA